MQYGFDKHGGFFAIDHYARVAAYAYASSPHADAAKRRPEAIAKRMLAQAYPLREHYGAIVENHYLTVSENARGASCS